MSSREPGPDQSRPVEPRADILRRRATLYRVCLRDRIGAAPACDYFREVVAAEAELAQLLRSNRQEAVTRAPKVANTPGARPHSSV
jgi:hypothetical protein